MRLHHVNIVCDAATQAQTIAFYTNVLGLKRVPKREGGRPTGAWFELPGGQQIHLSLQEGSVPRNRAAEAHIALTVDDVDGLRHRMAQAGVPVEAARAWAGIDRFFARDPAGNRLELTSAQADG